VIISQANEKNVLYCKLEFKDNNNVAQYEALALGLEALRNMNITQLVVCGDSELVVEKVGNVWWSK
jgi:ribonuclease HI